MKRIGLIGGTSWVSTLDYYRLLNEGVQQRLGGHHSADLVLRSLNFQPLIEQLQNYAAIETVFAEAARDLHRAGVELLGIASNTGHKFLRRIDEDALLPLVHIGDVVGDALKHDGVTRIGVLGTSMTLSDQVMLTKFSCNHTINLVVPAETQRAQLDALIFGGSSRTMYSPMRVGRRSTNSNMYAVHSRRMHCSWPARN